MMKDLIELSIKAGDAIMRIYSKNTKLKVNLKSDFSPVTAADKLANEIICLGLKQMTPELKVISEELKAENWEYRKYWKTYWMIDPLDGTKEFLEKSDEFTVNISLIHKNEAVMGVIYWPVQKTVYYGSRKKGAYKQLQGLNPERINIRKRPDVPVILSSRRHNLDSLASLLKDMGKDYQLLAVGSSLKFCLLAEGVADIYPKIGNIYEWDVAAGHCILNEAGGSLLTLDKNPLYYNQSSDFIVPGFLAIADKNVNWFNILKLK